MRVDKARRWGRKWTGARVPAAALLALMCAYGATAIGSAEVVRPPASADQGTADDPCRFFTADAMGKAFGRAMKSSKLSNVCEYRGPGTDRVVVKISTGSEGTIFRHTKAASTQSSSGVKKVTTAVGEAYLDSTLSVFIGRVGNREAQIETTIQPFPSDAMVAVGGRILQSLAGK